VIDLYYHDELVDCMFTLILNSFHQSDSYKSGLKSCAFGSPQQLLVPRSRV
jgi:hypothetical protein